MKTMTRAIVGWEGGGGRGGEEERNGSNSTMVIPSVSNPNGRWSVVDDKSEVSRLILFSVP